MKTLVLGSDTETGRTLCKLTGCDGLKMADCLSIERLPLIFPGYDFLVNCINPREGDFGEIEEEILNFFVTSQLKMSQKPAINLFYDTAFTGKRGKYNEEDVPDNVGRGELGLFHPRNMYVLRVCLLGAKNIAEFAGFPKEKVNCCINHFLTPIMPPQVAKIIVFLIENPKYLRRKRHIVPAGTITEFTAYRLIAKYFQIPKEVVKTTCMRKVNRSLDTLYKGENEQIWRGIGYKNRPTFEEMLKEYALT